MDDVVVEALGLLALGRPGEALTALSRPGGGRLRRELAEHLAARHHGRVYDEPAAFQAFIGGGGNVELYSVVIARLAATYRELGARTILDVGSGDGRVVVPAVSALGGDAPELDLVEPSAALLTAAAAAATAAGLTARTHHGTVQILLAGEPDRRWDLAEATFALHAIEPGERTAVLAGLRRVAGAVTIVEFDVPAFDDGSPEHLAYLARRYERGVAEYDAGLVAQGFLMPVLVGQVSPDRRRHTWEQPATGWAAQLTDAGWHEVTVTPVADYWWAPAVMITATSGVTAAGQAAAAGRLDTAGDPGAGQADATGRPDVAGQLGAERAATLARIASLTGRFDDMVAASALTTGDDEHDPEGATIAFERAQVSALLDQARADLDWLDRAAARLADGTYGVCRRCGGPIAAERLEVLPAADTCIACARAADRRP